MKKVNTFAQSLSIVAAALGRRCGVEIEFGADCAKTDGKTIYLPNLAAASADEERRVLGLLCHECGHVRFTNMRASAAKRTPFEAEVDNALEDVRIEREMNELYPGAERLFEAAHRPVVEGFSKRRIRKGSVLIPLFLLASAEEKLLNRAWLHDVTNRVRKSVQSQFGPQLTAQLETLALEVKDAKSLADVQTIRRKVMALLATPTKEQSKEKETSSHEQGKGNKPMPTPPTPLDLVMADGTKNIDNPLSLTQAFEQLKAARGKTEHEDYDSASSMLRPVRGNGEIGRRRLRQAREDSAELRRSLLLLVQAKAQVSRSLSERGRWLETRLIARIVTGERRIFRHRTEYRAVNTAVHVLLDLSGSMGITGGELALRASLGLIQALENIPHTNPALTVFPGAACGRSEEPCCTVVTHGQSLASVDPREIGAIDSYGGTPLLIALSKALRNLTACKETAKAVFLVTDGSVRQSALSDAVKAAQQAGIQLYGIQIGMDEGITSAIQNSERILDIKDLKTVLFRFARSLLSV